MLAGADIPRPILEALLSLKEEILGRGKTSEQQRLTLTQLSLRELVTCLTGAFLLRNVLQAEPVGELESFFESMNDTLGPCQQGVSDAIAAFRTNTDTTLRRAYFSPIEGTAFREGVLLEQADALTLRLANTLIGYEDAVAPTSQKWTALLRQPVTDALSLKYIISSAREQYEFSWPVSGADQNSKWMIGAHDNDETVVATVFARLEVWKDGLMTPVRRAMVELV